MSPEYPIRCDCVELKGAKASSGSANQSELPGQAAIYSIYMLFSITNFGPSLNALPARYNWDCVPPDNAYRFSLLSGDYPTPLVLPHHYYYLYYILCRRDGVQTIELTPANKDGYTDALPEQLADAHVKIVITYSATLETEKLRQIISLKQPVMLKFVVLDKDGYDDLTATCELYNDIYQRIQQSYDSGDDDYWMYRSRPYLWPFS